MTMSTQTKQANISRQQLPTMGKPKKSHAKSTPPYGEQLIEAIRRQYEIYRAKSYELYTRHQELLIETDRFNQLQLLAQAQMGIQDGQMQGPGMPARRGGQQQYGPSMMEGVQGQQYAAGPPAQSNAQGGRPFNTMTPIYGPHNQYSAAPALRPGPAQSSAQGGRPFNTGLPPIYGPQNQYSAAATPGPAQGSAQDGRQFNTMTPVYALHNQYPAAPAPGSGPAQCSVPLRRPFDPSNPAYAESYFRDTRAAFARNLEASGIAPAHLFPNHVPQPSAPVGQRPVGSGQGSVDHRGLTMLLAAAEQVLGPLVAGDNRANQLSNQYQQPGCVGNVAAGSARPAVQDHGSYMSYVPQARNYPAYPSQSFQSLQAQQNINVGEPGRVGNIARQAQPSIYGPGNNYAQYGPNDGTHSSQGYQPVQWERPPNVRGNRAQGSGGERLPGIADLLQTVERMHVDDQHHRPTNTIGATPPQTSNWQQLSTTRTPVRQGQQSQSIGSAGRAQQNMPSTSLAQYSISKRAKTAHKNDNDAAFANATNMEPFNIFAEFLKRPELTFILAKHLRVQELLTLYSISKAFHNVVNMRLSTTLFSQALMRAPDSAVIFPFRCYAKLCHPDPFQRPHPVSEKASRGEVRTVPTFRWLFMVCFREMVCHEIITILAEDGIPLPDECEVALKKIWLMMDIPDNHRRIGLVQNTEIFTDVDLFFATMFFVKLDMRFNDPITGNGKDGMRRMLLSQPSLSALWRALKRTAFISKLDVMKAFVRWKHNVAEEHQGMSVLGVPPAEIGIMQYENWGRSGSRVPLQRPDELILKEGVRRRLRMQEKYTDMFLWGYIDPKTMENVEPRKCSRKLKRLEGLEEMLVPKEDKEKVVPNKIISSRVIVVDEE